MHNGNGFSPANTSYRSLPIGLIKMHNGIVCSPGNTFRSLRIGLNKMHNGIVLVQVIRIGRCEQGVPVTTACSVQSRWQLVQDYMHVQDGTPISLTHNL